MSLVKLLDIVNEIFKINLPFQSINFKTIVVKPYLIEFKDNDPKNTLKTKHKNKKNG